MCTATWIRTGEGYEVFFNRDELATRKPARPPAIVVREGVRILAPADGDAGGTWLGANELGITIGLANGAAGAPFGLAGGTVETHFGIASGAAGVPSGFASGDAGAHSGVASGAAGAPFGFADGAAGAPGVFRSRGLLVLDLLASEDLSDVERRLEADSGTTYRPFSLFAIDGTGRMLLAIAGGEGRFEILEGELGGRPASGGELLFSSSREPVRARAERERVLARMRAENGGLDAALLGAFHASHEPERGAFSPCMHREDAGTVSFSHVRVGAREIVFDYRPGPLCGVAEVSTARIAR